MAPDVCLDTKYSDSHAGAFPSNNSERPLLTPAIEVST